MKTLKELGEDMIHEGRLSEFHKNQGNLYMYSFHHSRYLKMKKEFEALKSV